MGREGDKLDTFVSQFNRDMVACKMESFRWTDFSVLIIINTLRSSDKNKEKLAERLNHLYDAAENKNKVLDVATMQAEVRSFWRAVKENRELTFKGNGNKGGPRNQGGNGNQGGPGQGAGGQGRRKRKKKNKSKEEKEETASNVGVTSKGEARHCYRCENPQKTVKRLAP